MRDLNKYRGCLVGGAVGDALGYSVEFMDLESIIKKYGEVGITEYELQNGIAEISDDTQMTLFTASGLLLGATRGMTRGIMGKYSYYVWICYKEWLDTQYREYPLNKDLKLSWLTNVPELFHSREPGRTCIDAIAHEKPGNLVKALNNSKGCGGIMRVAPVSLHFDTEKFSMKEIDWIGAEVAALTHGHELGYVPAAALVHVITMLAQGKTDSILEAVKSMQIAIEADYGDREHVDELLALIARAIDLSQKEMDDKEAIAQLGEGWVAEETLTIAIYCALKYHDDFEKAIIASVNHSGDSDSTGAVTGNIIGAHLGIDSIPQKYLENLELKNVILEMADDLYNGCPIRQHETDWDEKWVQKYIDCTFVPE